MKIMLVAFLCGCGPVFAGEPVNTVYAYRAGSMSMSTLPRLDILKVEMLLPDRRFGLGVTAFALRYGGWEYPVEERSFDRWGRHTGQALYPVKSKFLTDYFPVSVFYSPYTWEGNSGGEGSLRFFYEYSSTWLLKDQHGLSANCAFGNNSLGNRTANDYGAVLDIGGGMRFRVGHVSVKRAASVCDAGEDLKVYRFGTMRVNRWYAGIELLFGGSNSAGEVSYLDDIVNICCQGPAGSAKAGLWFWGAMGARSFKSISEDE
ncbi:MAG: hypothetical protein PHV33_13140 [Elusimicrobiales bacterium]|nr:hypothetical protein [Elusimicrobiales bacterium]